MDPPQNYRLGRVEEIFHKALERASAERSAFLDEACAGDQSLRKEVEMLIRSDEQVKDGPLLDAPSHIETPASEISNDDKKATPKITDATSRQTAGVELSDFISAASFEPTNFPVLKWDRYEFVKFLGKGGMGAVYLARDPKLDRLVALKFIRGGDPEQIERLAHEARAQARIDHENACRVYEVGEVDGKHYIAMQYVAGESAGAACAEMSLEMKVKIVKETAEALHCAHRMGIIHRDVKPANIMVERDESGTPHALVMDFGLARDLEDDQRLTMAGMIMGTPCFMSPEQANGEVDKLDRRSDVFSLGATMYELFSGKLAFDGKSNFETITNVVFKDPLPLRKQKPSIPIDLETITMKCLEKDPIRRYDSAKALADDLQRYLDGEPILSQQSSLLYRAVKLAKKNKAVTVVIASAFIAVAILSAVAIRTRMAANEQARLAEQFGREAEKIERIMERAYILPLHDIGRERALVAALMEKIRNRMAEAGSVGKSAGYYALGRGYLSLHDYEKAREHLQLALKGGYRTEEIALPMGLVLGELYYRKLDEMTRTESRDLWEARKKEIDREYREEALRYLSDYASSGKMESGAEAAYVEAKIAFYGTDFEKTIKKAREAFEESPWLYAAKKLEAYSYDNLGKQELEKGNIDQALVNFAKAEESYANALEIGHSDADIYLGKAVTNMQRMEIESEQGRAFDEQFDKVIAACDMALKADSKNAEAYGIKSSAYYTAGDYQITVGREPVAFEKAIEAARLAVEIDPRNFTALTSMGLVHYSIAQYNMEHGLDPIASLDLSAECFKKIVEIDPSLPGILSNLGNAYWRKGLYEKGLGADPSASLDKAVESYKKAVKINPNYSIPYSNLGNAYEVKGEYETSKGVDPSASLQNAIENYKKAIAINPNLANPYINIGLAYKTKGTYEILREADPRSSLDESVKNFRRSLEINPNFPFALVKMAEAYMKIAESGIKKGLEPADSLKSALVALEEAERINPNYFEVYLRRGQADLIDAQWSIASGRSPDRSFKDADAALRRAIQLNPKSADAYQAAAEYYRSLSELNAKRNRPTRAAIEEGSAMIEKALAINPNKADAVALQGAFSMLRSRLSTRE